MKYLKEGRIKVDKSKHPQLTTYHDPCNYGRKSEKIFGHGYFDEPRWVTQQCCENFVDTDSTKANNLCCGAGGGAWAMPYSEERIYYGREKAKQIKDTGAELVIAPCHNCRDQLLKSLVKEYDLGTEIMYIWELIAESLIVEPWSEEEIKKGKEESDAQWEKFGVDLDEEMY